MQIYKIFWHKKQQFSNQYLLACVGAMWVIFSSSACSKATDNLSLIIDPTPSPTIISKLAITPSSKAISVLQSAVLSASGGKPPYQFSISQGGGSLTPANNASLANYSAPSSESHTVIRVTDSDGMAAYSVLEITSAVAISPSSKTLVAGNQFLFGLSGGKPPYSFSVLSGMGSINATTGEFSTPVTNGTSIIQITDSTGTSSNSTLITESSLTLTPPSNSIEPNGSFQVATSGGIPPYQYSILAGNGTIDASTGNYVAPDSPGNEIIQTTDSAGNSAIARIIIRELFSANPKKAFVKKNTQFTIGAIGGLPPYSFSLSEGGIGTVGQETGIYSAPNSTGNTSLIVSDARGETDTVEITVTDQLTYSIATMSVGTNSTVNLTEKVSGGISPYIFSALEGQGLFNGSIYHAPNISGIIRFNVFDSQSPIINSIEGSLIINPALKILPNLKVIGASTQQLFTSTGGAQPYTFSIRSGGGSITSSGNYSAPSTAQTVIIDVTDSLGSKATSTITVTEALSITPKTKNLTRRSNFTFSASGGISPYTYRLVSGGGSIQPTSGVYVAPSATGIAVIEARDASGHLAEASIQISNDFEILPSHISLLKNSTITFNARGGKPPYSYSIQSGNGSIHPTSGAYIAPSITGAAIIKVTDSDGNATTSSIDIYETLLISPLTQLVTINQSLTFSAQGGEPPYNYSILSGEGSVGKNDGIFSSSSAGTAIVQVTDSKHNSSTAVVTIHPTFSVNPNQIKTSTGGRVTITPSGGIPPYTFTLTSGEGTISEKLGDYIAPATSGVATIQVSDSIGSTAITSVTIQESLKITPSTSVINPGGTEKFSATGGISPYNYSIISGGGLLDGNTYSATAISDGEIVRVRVTDSNGDHTDATIQISKISVSIDVPNTSDFIKTSNQIEFSVLGNCSENGSYVILEISDGISTVNGSTICTGSSWWMTVNLSSLMEGPITFTAKHSNSNFINTTPYVTVTTKDITKPTVAITSPETLGKVASLAKIRGTCSEAGLPVYISSGVNQNAVTTCTSDHKFSATLNITSKVDGQLNICADHSDAAGNSANQSTIIATKDSISPETPILTINSGSTYTTSTSVTVNISGSEALDQMYVTNIAGCNSGGTWETYSASKSWILSQTNISTKVYAKVMDLAGNESPCASASIIHDNIPSAPPANLSLVSPSSSLSNQTNPMIRIFGVTSADTISLHTDSTCSSLSVKASGVSTGATIDLQSSTLTIDGTYSFHAKSTDPAGNSSCSNAIVNYTLDVQPPEQPLLTINGGSVITGTTSVILQLSASESPLFMYVTNNPTCSSEGTWEPFSNSKNWTLGQINSLTTVYAKVRDLAGNESSCSLATITHDNQYSPAPSSISLMSPASSPSTKTTPTIRVGGIQLGDTISLHTEKTCSDATLKASEIASGSTIDLTTTVLSENSYQFYARAKNIRGFSICSFVYVDYMVDLTPPTVSILTPASTTTINKYNYQFYNINGTCSENGRNVVLTITGQANKNILCSNRTWSSSLDMSASPEGIAAVSIKATHTDAAGNIPAEQSVIVTKDTIAPSSESITIAGGATYTQSSAVTLSLFATDNPTEMFITNGPNCDFFGSWENYSAVKYWPLAIFNSTADISVKFRDAAENESNCVSGSIIHDSNPPSIPVNFIDGSSGTVTSSPTMHWTESTDGESGISSYEITIRNPVDDSVIKNWTDVGNVKSTIITGLSLTHGSTYYSAIRARDLAGNISEVAVGDSWVARDPNYCPPNYIRIYPLSPYTDSPFCVAKYESKKNLTAAASTATGTPWISITQASAIDACKVNGPEYDLISNAEWQSIARNIEYVAKNWSSGIRGNGSMNRGHSDSTPNSALPASVDSDPCYLTGQICSPSQWNSQRRTHTLSTGDVIWDMSGNVWEWVKYNYETNFGTSRVIIQVTDTSNPAVGTIGQVTGTAKTHFGTQGDYSSTYNSDALGVGQGIFNPIIDSQGNIYGGIIRGAYHSTAVTSANYAGVFSVRLDVIPNYAGNTLGFRCVYHP